MTAPMTDLHRLLLVEDDRALGQQLVKQLEGAGYAVDWLEDGDAARRIEPEDYALLILDLMLPGTYGLDLLKLYRKSSEVPVLILSAREATDDKVRALKLGADDYVTKPFWPEELEARISARLRRPEMRSESGQLVIGPIVLDPGERTVMVEGQLTPELTKVEFDILHMLARRPGSAISRVAIVDQVLDPEKMGHERTLDVHISRIRKKLGSAGSHLATVWGIGYRLLKEPQPARSSKR